MSGDGDYDSSQEYKESIPYFSEIWLTVIEWLGIDLTDTDSVNAPSFCHIYLHHSLGEQPALNVAFMLGFKEFEASGVVSKIALMQEEVFAWTSLFESLCWTAP